jgi:predicted methyltransferase
MKNKVFGTAVVLALTAACGASSPQPTTTPESEPTAETSVNTASPSPAPVAPPPPSPEELERQKKLAELEKERAAMRAEHEAEVARFTPELRASAKALAEKAYPTTRAALKAAMASQHRKPGNAARDVHRHPLETLEFFGLKPTMTVLEFSPGEGWYTELLAPTLAAKGKLIATSSDPNGPADARSTFYGERFKLFTETSPELYGKIETVIVDNKAPDLKQEGTLDMALLMRAAHGMVNQGTLNAWLAEFHKALKPNGVLGIEQHRAADDAVPEESAKKGYLPQKWLIAQVEAAGFKLAGKSEINANKKDTKDYPEGVWALPPSYALGDKDREKYEAIGESDRMTLKFVKKALPAQKPAAAAAEPAAAPNTAAPAAPATGPAPSPAAPAAKKKPATEPTAPAPAP